MVCVVFVSYLVSLSEVFVVSSEGHWLILPGNCVPA